MEHTVLDSLETASKHQEGSIVTELGTDRLIRWLGVYMMLLLAVMAKVGDYLLLPLACHPVAAHSGFSGENINFANTYCWSEHQFITNSTNCNIAIKPPIKLLDKPDEVKNFVKAVPYILAVQAFMFSFPLVFWNFRVGARLVGHLRFVQLLLNKIFEKMQMVGYGIYESEPYDEAGTTLDGRRKWVGQTSPPKERTLEIIESESSSLEETPLSIQTKADRKLGSMDVFLAGKMKDRNFFSMLCYENFSYHHLLPFIVSTFKLSLFTPVASAEGKYIHKPLLETMIYLWCNKKNLNNTFLLKMYAAKQLATSFLALAMLISLITWFFSSVHNDVVASKTFRCEIPFESPCVLCTIKRLPEVIVLFLLDLVVSLAILILSVWQWIDVRSSDSKDISHFFDNLKTISNVALMAVDDDK